MPTPMTTPAKPVEVIAPGSTDRFGGRKVRCGVVGVGRMGRHHARVYAQNLPGCELVGVVDGRKETRDEHAAKWNCRAFATPEELLAHGVDAVSIAVPTTSHEETARPFLEKGVACLIEKPLAGDAETARRIRDTAERAGACLMVGHIERFNPVMRAVQKAAKEGPPIIPRFMQVIRVSPMTFRSVDVGVVMDMMIHDIDVVLMLMGKEPDRIRAAGVSVVSPYEDLCDAWLEFDTPHGRCVANVTASRLAFKTERVTRITGENAYIKIDYGAKKGNMIRRTANELQVRELQEAIRKGVDLTTLKWDELVVVDPLIVDDAEPIVAEIGEFIDAVRFARRPSIDAEAGFANVRTAERIVNALRDAMGALPRQA
ncbi:MAG TPA: Gfo/Idh/MocA family oxidoreductase [Phycisphaerales bacterium]|nr:Gfo/Idh/MocA family oxidoreductase [Phycisphaerales bacterium]